MILSLRSFCGDRNKGDFNESVLNGGNFRGSYSIYKGGVK